MKEEPKCPLCKRTVYVSAIGLQCRHCDWRDVDDIALMAKARRDEIMAAEILKERKENEA